MADQFPGFKIDAESLLIEAIVQHEPSSVFALFSGGHDSSVLLSWARITIGRRLDAAVYIDTGTALPGVRDFVEMFCADCAVPLIVLEAGNAYRRMVRRYGMPGPGAHRYPYVWLKERQLDQLIRDHKTHHRDRILLLAGARRDESDRRMGKAVPVERDGCTVWANPLIDWTNADMLAYRREHSLLESDVAALLHRSGECNCGAFAAPGEREELQALWPEWFADNILVRENEAARAGLPCVWGERAPRRVGADRAGRLCQRCPDQLALLDAV